MVKLPKGWRCEQLKRSHPRSSFRSGQAAVDEWFSRRALQNQEKHLSVTRALVTDAGAVAGYYTLAMGQVDFGALPVQVAKHVPKRALPVAILTWLGVDGGHQGKGLGARLLAQALADCYHASVTFPFVAVILDCVDQDAKAFYERWDFREVPGHPMRLYLSTRALAALMQREPY